MLWGATSDHLACFSVFKNITLKPKTPKYIKICKSDDSAIEKFVEEIRNKNIYELLDHNLLVNPNANSDIIEKIIDECKSKHMPSRTVKYNKHKYRK